MGRVAGARPVIAVESGDDGQYNPKYATPKGKLKRAGQKLVTDFYAKYPVPARLAAKVMRPTFVQLLRSGLTKDDIGSLCDQALIYAARKYQPGRAGFVTYAAYWMRGILHHRLSRIHTERRNFGRIVQGSTPVGRGRKIETEILKTVADRRPGPVSDDRMDATRFAEKYLRILDQRQLKVLDMRYGLSAGQLPMTQDAIGREIGLSKERVRQIIGQAIGRLYEAAVAEYGQDGGHPDTHVVGEGRTDGPTHVRVARLLARHGQLTVSEISRLIGLGEVTINKALRHRFRPDAYMFRAAGRTDAGVRGRPALKWELCKSAARRFIITRPAGSSPVGKQVRSGG
mgnify:CR=1 FL=1